MPSKSIEADRGLQDTSPLVRKAEQLYDEFEMDALPPALRRNSLDYYYLSVYPSLKAMSELGANSLPAYPDLITSAYLHIPFCSGVCDFCSYFLTTVDRGNRSPISDYLELVKKEVITHQGKTELNISYLYFGGGTPSLIPIRSLEGLFAFLKERGVLADSTMGTLELHPEFFTNKVEAQQFINILKANGVQRVSLGYQSADEAMLADNNRRHGPGFLRDAIGFLKENGMLVNLDLMYGLADMSKSSWEKTLREAVAANPDSIATYFLFVDPGTVTFTEVKNGKIVLPDHRTVQVQHIMAQLFLEEKGYYELPSDFFAQPWGNPADFKQERLPSQAASLPLGSGAYGFYSDTQFYNQFSLKKYRAAVQSETSPIWRGYKMNDVELLHRDMMFSFKNDPHIDRELFHQRYGIDPYTFFFDKLETLRQYGLVTIDNKVITLTAKGRLCVEEIANVFQSPSIRDNDLSQLPAAERKKIEKHNYSLTYPAL
jgi:oxygen-independent coproporphyrinogen-3 oxidase